ncbi:unnamed protein product, partial [Brassica rapa subsp. trilocularis]
MICQKEWRERDKGLQRLAQGMSLTLSYRYEKRVFMMLKEVENPKANGGFDFLLRK